LLVVRLEVQDMVMIPLRTRIVVVVQMKFRQMITDVFVVQREVLPLMKIKTVVLIRQVIAYPKLCTFSQKAHFYVGFSFLFDI